VKDTQSIARLDNISVRLGGNLVLDGISLGFPEHRVTAVIGTSGSGKSTLLQTLNGLVPVCAGRVRVLGIETAHADLFALRRRIGFAMQDAALFPHLKVVGNISLGARLAGWPAARIDKRIAELMALLELPDDLLDRYPHQLSGGQQQRVNLGRALMLDPELLLLDEPFSALDPMTRANIHDWFQPLMETSGKAAIMITHDFNEALRLADHLVVLRSGRLLYAGPITEEWLSEANPDRRACFDKRG